MASTTHTRIFTLGACALLLSGCIVHATSSTGVLEVRWENGPTDCAGVDSVRVRVKRGGQLFDESTHLACSKGFHSFALAPGFYDVTIIALDSNGKVIGDGGLAGLQVESDINTLSPRLALKTGGLSGAGLRVTWTVAAQPAAQGCSLLDVDQVTVTVFDSKLSAIVAQSQVKCSQGHVTLAGMAAEDVWVQMDASDGSDQPFYGNPGAVGPIGLTDNIITALSQTLNLIDLRASINIPWQFANGKTCGSNSVNAIKVEIRRPGGDVLVPMSAADATKACDMGLTDTVDERAIDLQFVKPTCSIPDGVDGLIVCGILDRELDIRAVAVNAEDGSVSFGGWLKIRDLQAGVFSKNDKPLFLESCENSSIDCELSQSSAP